MNTKHTPVLPEICTECGSVDLHLKTNCGQIVSAQCQDCRYYWSLDTAFPVRLGNAAPELLAALQALFRQTVTLRLPPDANCLQMVAAAIAKAEGRA